MAKKTPTRAKPLETTIEALATMAPIEAPHVAEVFSKEVSDPASASSVYKDGILEIPDYVASVKYKRLVREPQNSLGCADGFQIWDGRRAVLDPFVYR